MKPRLVLPACVAAVFLHVAFAAGKADPFPVIEDVPERKLIGVEGNGYPSIAEQDKPAVARLAARRDTPEHLRFYAIWGLAISGYSAEAAAGLAEAVEDRELGSTARGYAAMGLRNFTRTLGGEEQTRYRDKLRTLYEHEGSDCPDSILRTLIAWGDAAWIANRLGDSLRGHSMELEILRGLPREQAVPGLMRLYWVTEPGAVRDTYQMRAALGGALAQFGDKRGIEILIPLLDAEAVPRIKGHPNRQYRHNVFAVIRRVLGRNFDYQHKNYDPEIDTAIATFRAWWARHRDDLVLPDRQSAGSDREGRSQ